METGPGQSLHSGELVARDASRLLIIDVQEKLVPLIDGAERMIAGCRMLIDAARVFGVPVAVTEQYPQGLGPTTPRLAEALPTPIQKLGFSAAEALGWGTAAEQPDGRHQVILAGIEAHVCVLQTALDLLAAGFQVFVVADAVSSRHSLDRETALARMASSGATIVTAESVLFEWCEVSGTPEFRETSRLVKGRASA